MALKFEHAVFGTCYVLRSIEGLSLFEIPNNSERYVVAYVDDSSDGSWQYAHYHKDYSRAVQDFLEVTEEAIYKR